MLAQAATAQSGGAYVIRKSSIDGGAGRAIGGSYAVLATAGQHDTGQASGGDYVVRGGFWFSAEVSPDTTLLPPAHEPNGVEKPRFFSFVLDNPGQMTALRVRLISMHHPAPPPTGTPDFSFFEGQFRYVNSFAGGVLNCPGAAVPPSTYKCARLGCQPEYRDWAADLDGEVLHVTGDAVLPSSTYGVSHMDSSCGAAPQSDTCSAATSEFIISTGRFGDVTGFGMGPPDGFANVLDIAAIVDRIKELPTSFSEPRCWQKRPFPNPVGEPINTIDLAHVVDSVKDLPIPGNFVPGLCP